MTKKRYKKLREVFTDEEIRQIEAEDKKALSAAIKIGVPTSIITSLLCKLLSWLLPL